MLLGRKSQSVSRIFVPPCQRLGFSCLFFVRFFLVHPASRGESIPRHSPTVVRGLYQKTARHPARGLGFTSNQHVRFFFAPPCCFFLPSFVFPLPTARHPARGSGFTSNQHVRFFLVHPAGFFFPRFVFLLPTDPARGSGSPQTKMAFFLISQYIGVPPLLHW